MEEINKEVINKDLEAWATKIVNADKLLREVYDDIHKVFNQVNDKTEQKEVK